MKHLEAVFRQLALLLLTTKERGHRSCVHDSKILIAVVEDRVRALGALLLQIAKPFGERLELPFRIQIFEPLGCRNIAFEPVLAVPAMKANIDPSGRSQLLSIPTGAVVSTPRASAILTGARWPRRSDENSEPKSLLGMLTGAGRGRGLE
jgi:hypothetical protein